MINSDKKETNTFFCIEFDFIKPKIAKIIANPKFQIQNRLNVSTDKLLAIVNPGLKTNSLTEFIFINNNWGKTNTPESNNIFRISFLLCFRRKAKDTNTI